MFDKPANPGELPENTLLDPDFITTDYENQSFSADSNSPPPKYGVEPGEWVAIHFDLQPQGTLEDVIGELSDGTLRIGIHLQGFAGGSSESAVNIPEPATLALLGLGALGIFRIKRG